MASLSDLKPTYQLFMRTYRYRQVDWAPGAQLTKPLAEARVAVVTTAALHTPEQPPFDESVRGGDYSFRIIEQGTDPHTLKIAHRSDAFDHAGLEEDPNLALPLDRLEEMAARGQIGAPASYHLSFMGSISAPARLIHESAPQAADLLADDGVNAVLLTPV